MRGQSGSPAGHQRARQTYFRELRAQLDDATRERDERERETEELRV